MNTHEYPLGPPMALTPIVDQLYISHELPPLVNSCHIIPHNLLSDEHV
jgi:hypothetical protein